MTLAMKLPPLTVRELVSVTQGVLTGLTMTAEGNDARFAEGVDMGNQCVYVSVAVNNVWGAQALNGGCITSYERIGYHAGSVDFINGVLSTDCPVVVYRTVDGVLTKFQLVTGG